MMRTRHLLLFTAALMCLHTASGQERLRRDQSFLGIHFDFHAGPDCNEVGKNTTPEMVNAILDMVHPDYIQIDCKGHPGYSSYPTQVGNQVPGYVGDPLKVWREVTAKRGVSLYMHYSGVWDSRAIELHPDWAAIDKDGTPSKNANSLFGPYVDRLLIPQLKELAGEYGIDGAWVDGECWATPVDYNERAVKLFCERTGASKAPISPEDPFWYEWKQFHREAFRQYLRHYVSEVHREYPEFQICSNWAYTHHMSEPVSAPVDFLSGDYSSTNSVNSARIAARYLTGQGVPWDLMAWSFGYKDGKSLGQKPSVQLKREAAITLAQGGGFQAYYTQNRDGSFTLDKLKSMADVAAFARERQEYCHHSVAVPQVVVLLSTFDYQHYNVPGNPGALFPNYTGRASGILQCLLENQYSVDLLGETSLLPDLGRFPLIVIPECDSLPGSFCDDLLDHVSQGGSVLVVGEKMSRLFSNLTRVSLQGREWFSADFGYGKIGFIPEAVSNDYENGIRPDEIRTGMKDLVTELFPEPMVEVKSSPFVDVSLRTLKGKLQVHLVNTSGNHRGAVFMDSIDPVEGIEVSVRCPSRPKSIVRRPDGKPVPFSYNDGKATFKLDALEIYDIIEIEA